MSMRKFSPLLLLGFLLPLVLPPNQPASAKALAGATPIGKKAVDPNDPQKFAAPYDKNHNGVLDDEEVAAMRKDYAAALQGPLKVFDLNHDGVLDDVEISLIKLPKVKVAKKKSESTGSKLFGKGQ